MDLEFPIRRMAILVASVALIAGACSSAGTSVETIRPIDTPVPSTPPTAEPTSQPTEPAAGALAIDLSEWKVDMPSTLTAGTANFSVTNNGTIAHELLVFKSELPLASYPKDANGDIVEDGPGITLQSDDENVDPGGTQARTVDLSAPGTYVFVCNIPGHFKAGMYTVVTVAPAAAADVNIDLSEWKVNVPTTIKAGNVNLVMKNNGTIQHELLVFKSDLPLASYPKDASGDIVEDGPGVSLVSDGENIDPAGTQTRALDLTMPGTYLFVCNIPGHFKAGMYTVVTVTP